MESAHHLFKAVDSITSFGKVSHFTRPASPHPDHQFKFLFSKAQSPQLDFTIGRKQTQRLPANATAHRLESARSAETTVDPNLRPNEGQDLETGKNEEPRDLCRSAETSATHLPGTDASFEDTIQTPMKRASPTATAEISATPDSGVLASYPGNVRPSTQIAEYSFASPSQERPLPQEEHCPQTRASEISRKRQDFAISNPLVSKFSSNGELLGILLSRFEAEQLNREELRASQLAKDTEIQDLKGVSQTLYEQLQSVKDRERAQEIEISELNKIKLQWQHRIQKMNEYVQTLMDDHQRLRKDAREIQEHQKSIQTEKCSLETTLKDVHLVIDQDRSRTKKILLEARHEMEMLEQTVSDQDRQLRQNADLLLTERDRSQGLGDAISRITTSYQDLTRLFEGYKDAIMEKLSDLVRSGDDQIAAAAEPQKLLKPMLDQCLQELRQLDMVKQKDFLTLNTALKSYATSLKESMEDCERTASATKEGQQQLSSELQRQLGNLNDNIHVKDALGEQLMDLREVKATIRERLHATEASLVIARQHAAALESKELFHLRRISELESEGISLQNKGSELQQMILRLDEAEACNKNLEKEIANMRHETLRISESLEKKLEEVTCLTTYLVQKTDEVEGLNAYLEKKSEEVTGLNTTLEKATEEMTGLNACLQERSKEVTGLNASLSEVQSQLDEACAKMATFADQKAEYESQAAAQSDKMRKQLSQAASLELARLESEHLNELQQLRQQRAVAEDRAEQQRIAAEAKADQLIKQLDKLHAEKASSQSNTLRNTAREPMAPRREPASPAIRSNPSHGTQPGGRPDLMPWQLGRLAPRASYPDWSGPVPSSVKRIAPEVGVDAQPPKRARKLVSQGLGPVIPDSLSPNRARGRSNRKQSKGTGKNTPAKEKYEHRFSQELEME